MTTLHNVLVIIKNINEDDALIISLGENLWRNDSESKETSIDISRFLKHCNTWYYAICNAQKSVWI